MGNYIYFALIAGVIAVIFAVFKARKINKYDAGNEKMKEIADAIAEGAKAFLFAEYKILIIFVVILFIVLGVGIDWLTAVCSCRYCLIHAGWLCRHECCHKGKCTHGKCRKRKGDE